MTYDRRKLAERFRYAVLGFLIGFVAGGTVGLLAGELT